MPLGKALVHAEEVARKDGRLVTACATPDLHDGVLGVIRIRGDEQYLDLLFELRKKRQRNDIDYLSMGMTSDYAIAVEEGANMVRVGTALFGARDYSNRGY